MSRAIVVAVVLGLACANGVLADDSMSRTTMTKRQAMHDCIEQQKTLDVSMSKSEMKRICKDKLKHQAATGEMPEQPARDAPQS